ncbi:MAG TPA: hypothetical protein ENJ00_00025 [Phycisphaerales bacterium]|nr:hypothetical protein [Phycisphaerales bacterium]
MACRTCTLALTLVPILILGCAQNREATYVGTWSVDKGALETLMIEHAMVHLAEFEPMPQDEAELADLRETIADSIRVDRKDLIIEPDGRVVMISQMHGGREERHAGVWTVSDGGFTITDDDGVSAVGRLSEGLLVLSPPDGESGEVIFHKAE